jgi:hypothetical protein
MAPLSPEVPDPLADGKTSPEIEAERRFEEIWRDELLGQSWAALREFETRSGQPLHTVLRLRADHPELRAPEMAERLAPVLGKEVSPEWVRKRLFLAREKFTTLLVESVARTLSDPSAAEIEQELIDLGLLDYCRSALERWPK